jgi:molecular chaperone DnaK
VLSQTKLGEAIYSSPVTEPDGATEEPAAEASDEDIVDAEIVDDEEAKTDEAPAEEPKK